MPKILNKLMNGEYNIITKMKEEDVMEIARRLPYVLALDILDFWQCQNKELIIID